MKLYSLVVQDTDGTEVLSIDGDGLILVNGKEAGTSEFFKEAMSNWIKQNPFTPEGGISKYTALAVQLDRATGEIK